MPRNRIYTKRRSRFIYLDYTHPLTGERIRESSGYETEAEARDELQRRLHRAVATHWREAVVHFFEQRSDLKPTTMHQYRNSIRALDPFVGDLLMSEVTLKIIKSFVAHRRLQVSDPSVRRDLATGSTIWTTAQMTLPKEVPDMNPFQMFSKRHLKENRRNRYLTPEEFNRLKDATVQDWQRDVLDIFVYTGMRHRELIQAEKSWIKWDLGEIQLPGEFTKNSEPRIIPMFPKLRDTLEKRCALSEGKHIFSHWDHQRQEHVPYTSFQGFFRLARDRADLKDIRIHDLRHTFASWWSQNGGDLLALKSLLGHADLRMVERYSHLNTESQHRAVAEISRRIEKN